MIEWTVLHDKIERLENLIRVKGYVMNGTDLAEGQLRKLNEWKVSCVKEEDIHNWRGFMLSANKVYEQLKHMD